MRFVSWACFDPPHQDCREPPKEDFEREGPMGHEGEEEMAVSGLDDEERGRVI